MCIFRNEFSGLAARSDDVHIDTKHTFSINPYLGSGDPKWIFPTKNPKSSFLKITIFYTKLKISIIYSIT